MKYSWLKEETKPIKLHTFENSLPEYFRSTLLPTCLPFNEAAWSSYTGSQHPMAPTQRSAKMTGQYTAQMVLHPIGGMDFIWVSAERLCTMLRRSSAFLFLIPWPTSVVSV